MDACHAGTMYRDADSEEVYIRGTKLAFSPSGSIYKTPHPVDKTRSHYHIEQSDGYADVLLLEACQAYETNHEIQRQGMWYGPLSFYINDVLCRGARLDGSTEWIGELKELMDGDIALFGQHVVTECSK